ncbi:MAG: hypothetical protein JNM90_08930 [Burkholderiales bacterium]|nr:hypothetical protein [Burkholderiales bacterium]
MYEIEEATEDQHAAERLRQLEARVEELERALSRLLGTPFLAPSDEHFAKTQKLPALAPASGGGDGLGITAAFATLDTRIAEAADFESSLLRKPDLAPIVPIDERLIEDVHVPRPRPQAVRQPVTLRVRSALEDKHAAILKKLTSTWRSPEGYTYLKKLIIDERGDRAGFGFDVMSELLFLSDILDTPTDGCAWTANGRSF